jgi:hypothetical protein
MPLNDVLTRYLRELELLRLGGDEPAGLWVTSLPLPREAPREWSLSGQPTFGKPLGQWHDAPGPRRLLLAADAGGQAPATLRLTEGNAPADDAAFCAEMETFAYAPAEEFDTIYWERSMLTLQWKGRKVGLALGMRVRGEVHWWEYCNIDILARSSECIELEMGGAIPHEITTPEMARHLQAGGTIPYIHRHNWLNGHIYARFHANGVCEVYAHHLNSMFADDGRDLPDAVPVIGFRVEEDNETLSAHCGAWDGERRELAAGGAAFDLTDIARLATPEKPGSLALVDGFLVLQPYLGMEMYGGKAGIPWRGNDYYWHAEQQLIPRGRGRTLRFSLSLNPERPPRVARYLAPAWWYGVCEEFQPRPLLPVANDFTRAVDEARRWAHKYIIPRGFEEGMLPNHSSEDSAVRQTPSCEGDLPGAIFLAAYRTTDPRDYDVAVRASYAFSDLCVDHAVNRVVVWPFGPPAVALPLQRAQGPLFAWLETGDPYCLNTAQAMIDTAYWWHKNSWPRRAIGRDACCVHSMLQLYRYLGDAHYLTMARNFIHDVGVSQWPDGAFGDQGGGAGIHGWASYIIKPWMGSIATMGALDLLEIFPDDEEAGEIVRKFVDWLMRERAPRRISHDDDTTVNGWQYMHNFRGKTLPGITFPDGPTPGGFLGHKEYFARLLPWFSFLTGDPAYFDAFMESYQGVTTPRDAGYWLGTAVLTYLPWLQDRLWNATLSEDGVHVQPAYFGERMPGTATIATPDGPLELAWTGPGALDAPPDARCTVELDSLAAPR